MEQACQVASLARAKPAHDVEQLARRGSSGVGSVASRDPMGGALPFFVTHDHLRGTDSPTWCATPNEAGALMTMHSLNITYSNISAKLAVAVRAANRAARRSACRYGAERRRSDERTHPAAEPNRRIPG